QYKKVQTLSLEFHEKIDEILKEDDGFKKIIFIYGYLIEYGKN
ncbi:hypothetical protein LCGC14_2964910, partial [marine sediment metagenome]